MHQNGEASVLAMLHHEARDKAGDGEGRHYELPFRNDNITVVQ